MSQSTEELLCASPLCSVSPDVHKRTGSCPPISGSTIAEILAALAEEAEKPNLPDPE